MPFEQQRTDHESGDVIVALTGTLTMGNELMKLEWVIEEILKEQHNKIVLDRCPHPLQWQCRRSRWGITFGRPL